MRRILPILIATFSILVVFLVASPVQAQVGSSPAPAELQGKWVEDPEVTFVGKTATRSNDFLNWTLQNYNWINVPAGEKNPLQDFWWLVAFTVYAVMFLFVLITAGVIIVTRGQNITIMRFIPRFILLIVLVTISFSLVRTFYDIGDIIQGWLLHVDGQAGPVISSENLLYIDFDYTFSGFRKLGGENDESAFITLLLVKLTAITYYVMSGVLLVRKIILWFFLIVSPILPLLILYRPVRNTAKIWVGEFFRWLLYAPLFALFLHGLVVMWRDKIPLPFDFSQVGTQVYPTAVNILIGGPGQVVSISNSVNLKDTFAQYVVALLMLWVVILLPFLLLRIFLDYLNSISLGNAAWMKQTINRNFPFLGPRGPGAGPLPPTPPGKVFPAGMARQLPFMKKTGATIGARESKTNMTNTMVSTQTMATNDVLKTVNISIPKMTDIARYETAIMSKDVTRTQEVAQIHETIEKIANPSIISQPMERERFSTVKERLVQQRTGGNQVASTILNSINSTVVTQKIDTQEIVRDILNHLSKPENVSLPSQRMKLTTLRQQLSSAKESGDPVASTVLSAADKVADETTTHEQKQEVAKEVQTTVEQAAEQGNEVAKQVQEAVKTEEHQKTIQSLPVVNKVQQVSIEEFEEVRKMWVENYEKLEPPRNLNGEQYNREEWIQNDIDRINEAITLLASVEPQKVDEGMQIVSGILPFLLMGGFSKSEVVTYLKAKLEAAKDVLKRTIGKKADEDSMISRGTKQAEKAEEMTMSVEKEPEKPLEENPAFKELDDQNTLEEKPQQES